jgi:hypothetical protein
MIVVRLNQALNGNQSKGYIDGQRRCMRTCTTVIMIIQRSTTLVVYRPFVRNLRQ